MNKAVIFDLDGTLLDTLGDIADNINLMLAKFGYPKRSEKEIMQFIGCGSRNLAKLSIPVSVTEEELNERHDYYNRIYTDSGSPKTHVFDGIKQVVKELKARGYKVAILTNKPQETTDNVYQNYMMDMGFDKVVGQRSGVKIKPDPTSALDILSEFSVEPKNAYFVGDGETDVLTAINGGMNGIAVLWGYRSKSQLENAGAKVFANTPLELLDIIF
ncbi:MAG: HAD family hydrolase [Clostridiales bacterium]|nr:HAD family hydrolase [Clostridiales bacterium]MBQ3046452.1 HAD family hydrolase [Clostridia bacterium]